MLISVEELQHRPVEFGMAIAAGALGLPEDVTGGEVEIRGEARAVGDGMRLAGRLHAAIQRACARCAEPAAFAVEREFDLLYQPESLMVEAGEVEIGAADTDIGFFRGAGVEVEEVAREQLLLAMPMQGYCRADCRGLCPRCGANRNEGACGCGPPVDERWQALDALRGRR